jgi:N-acetylmuramate 1-kinase
MNRIDLPEIAVDQRLDDATNWLQHATHDEWTSIAPASEDASFRRYFRVVNAHGASAIVMDAPPTLEDTRPFVNVLTLLAQGGVRVPQLLASDVERGFLLLDDLGRTTYLSALNALEVGDDTPRNELLHDAIDTLVCLQQIDHSKAETKLGHYHAKLLRREIDLFPDWYLAKHLQLELTDSEKQGLERVYATLIASAIAQPTVLCHRDYMPRNLMAMNDGNANPGAKPQSNPGAKSQSNPGAKSRSNPGVLDFQDAVVGPISYDIASLMRDAFISWEEPQVIDWTIRYWERAKKAGLPVRDDFAEFYREMEWMGLQRHLKIMGIFARINYRDGKPKYLADTPRFARYVRAVAQRYEVFAPMLRLFDRIESRETQVGYSF